MSAACRYLRAYHLSPSNLAVAISIQNAVVLSLTLPPRRHYMPRQAKSGCAEHHRAVMFGTARLALVVAVCSEAVCSNTVYSEVVCSGIVNVQRASGLSVNDAARVFKSRAS